MSGRTEPSWRQGPDESPQISLETLREVRWGQMAVRFIFGATTSLASGGVSLLFGARPGGILLAFPAILAATLTLIEKEEDSEDAREDARGALAGAAALAAYAGAVALLIGRVPGVVALATAAVTWLVLTCGLYFTAWMPRTRGTFGGRRAAAVRARQRSASRRSP
jgi:hypothetical protein